MKKEYKKPLIAVESFQLDAAIAGTCNGEGFIPIGRGAMECMFDVYYAMHCDAAGGVNVVPPGADPDDINNGICYHGPIAGATFLTS